LGLANLAYSRVEFEEGNYQAALARAMLAGEQMPQSSLHYNLIRATLARSLVAVQRAEEALPLARVAMNRATQRGGMLMDDLQPAIALTEALMALGQTAEARRTIAEAQKYIRMRCAALPKPQWKDGYLAAPERVRVFELVAALEPI
jgi:hypothetical protein